MFNSSSSMMCVWETVFYDNASNSYMKFYEEITSKIDDVIFQHLFTNDYESGKDGRALILLSTCIMTKEGTRLKAIVPTYWKPHRRKNKPNLITNIQVKGETAADNGYVEESIIRTEGVNENKVDAVYTDCAYQSENSRKLTSDKESGLELIAIRIEGKENRFELNRIDEKTFKVTDKETSEVITATPIKCK